MLVGVRLRNEYDAAFVKWVTTLIYWCAETFKPNIPRLSVGLLL